jgi:hypothetical protein
MEVMAMTATITMLTTAATIVIGRFMAVEIIHIALLLFLLLLVGLTA